MKKCQFCAEEIQDEAIKCRYCGEILYVVNGNVKENDKVNSKKQLTGGQIFGFVWGCLGVYNIYANCNNGSSDTALGFAVILNCILFVIPGILLFNVCKEK